MVRLGARFDTSVLKVMKRRTAIEPRIAISPTAIGSAAASRPPNTQTSTTKLSGTAIDSISSRSRCNRELICAFTMASPPDRTMMPVARPDDRVLSHRTASGPLSARHSLRR